MTDYRFGYIGCPRFVNAGLVNENVKEYVEMAPLTFVTSHLINSFSCSFQPWALLTSRIK